MVRINASAVFVHIAMQEFCCFHAKANDLHPSPVASFVASCCLLLSTTLSPISYGEREQFTDPRACLVGHAYDDLVSSAGVCLLEPPNESEVQSRIINGFWYPLVVYQTKVVVRSSLLLRLLNATFWRHLGARAACSDFLLVNLFEQVNDWIRKRMRVSIQTRKLGTEVKPLQS